jgi:membrane protease YdiL (CAAX protease family)
MNLSNHNSLLPAPNKKALIAGLVLVLAIPMALSKLLVLIPLNQFNMMLVSRFIFWAEAGLLYLYARKVERQHFLLWDDHHPLEFFIKWIILLYILAFAAGLVSAIPLLFGYKDNTSVLNKWVTVITARYWMMLFCAITAGITEELIFRAYLLTRLQQLFKNAYMPVIISAAMFSAMHYRYFSLRETIFTFLIGVIFAVHYQKYRNIHVLIIVHFLIDFLSFLLARYVAAHHIKSPQFGLLW